MPVIISNLADVEQLKAIDVSEIIIDIGEEEKETNRQNTIELFRAIEVAIESIADKSKVKTIKLKGEIGLDDNCEILPKLDKITKDLTSVTTLDLSDCKIDSINYQHLASNTKGSSSKRSSITDLILPNQQITFQRDSNNRVMTLKIEGDMKMEQASFLRAMAPSFFDIPDFDLSKCEIEDVVYLGQTIGHLDAIKTLFLPQDQRIIFQRDNQKLVNIEVRGGKIDEKSAPMITEIVTAYEKNTLDLFQCEIDDKTTAIFETHEIKIRFEPHNAPTSSELPFRSKKKSFLPPERSVLMPPSFDDQKDKSDLALSPANERVIATLDDFMKFDKRITVKNEQRNKLINQESANELVKFISDNNPITTINLSGSTVDKDAMKTIIDYIKESKLISSLMLSDDNVIDFKGDDANVIKSLKFHAPRQLKSSQTIIGIEQAEQLAIVIDKSQNLTTLDLSDCKFENGSLGIIAEAIKNHQSISSLDLKGATIGDKDLEILAPALKENKNIHYVDLANNQISNINLLENIVSDNPSIAFIALSNNNLGNFARQTEELDQTFKRRRKELLKENLLAAAIDLADAVHCDPTGHGHKYSDELFQSIRQYLKNNEEISIGIESSKTKGSIAEIINQQKSEILKALKNEELPKITLKKDRPGDRLIRKAQIIAILQITADLARAGNQLGQLEKLQKRLDLEQKDSDRDQEFLSQIFQQSINKLPAPTTPIEVSQADITHYDKNEVLIYKTPPLYKRFKLEILQRRFNSQESHRVENIDQTESPQLQTPHQSVAEMQNDNRKSPAQKLADTIAGFSKKVQDLLENRKIRKILGEARDYQPTEDSETDSDGEQIFVNPLARKASKDSFEIQIEKLIKLCEFLEGNDNLRIELKRLIADRFWLDIDKSLVTQLKIRKNNLNYQIADNLGFEEMLNKQGGIESILKTIETKIDQQSLFELYKEIIADPTVTIEDHSKALEAIRQKLKQYPDPSIPVIKGQTIEELCKSVARKVRENLPTNLPRSLPVEYYLDSEESKLYEQINQIADLRWDKKSTTKGRDGQNHQSLISFAATIDQNNQAKFRMIVAKAEGTFVHFPSQEQMMEKDQEVEKLLEKKIAGEAINDIKKKALKRAIINDLCQKEIHNIKGTSEEIPPIIDIIKSNYKSSIGASDESRFNDLTSELSTTSNPGFCIFRPKDKNIARVVFRLDENSDASKIDNVIYLKINGSDNKYLRIRVGTCDGEKIDGQNKVLKEGEIYIYPDIYSKACDRNSIVKEPSDKDLKARKNFNVLAVAISDKDRGQKKMSSSLMLNGEIHGQRLEVTGLKPTNGRDGPAFL